MALTLLQPFNLDPASSYAFNQVTVANSVLAGNISTSGPTGTVTGGFVNSTGNINAVGNISSGNVIASGLVSAVLFSGSGANLTNMAGANITGAVANAVYANTVRISYNNDGVGSFQLLFGNGSSVYGPAGITCNPSTSSVTANGNITGNYFIGNGSQLTGTGVKWTTSANTTPSSPNPGDFWYDSYTDTKYQYINDGSGNAWVDQGFPTSFSTLAVTGNIVAGNVSVSTGTVSVGNIVNTNGNGVGNIGSTSLYFNTVHAKATSAQYADLAEMYVADAAYAPGTLVDFGGKYEISQTTQSHSTRVAGVISTDPSYIMNAGQTGEFVLPVALTGKVPCQVTGKIRKGDRLVASHEPGVARALDPDQYAPGCIIGKSLQDHDGDAVTLIQIAVGRY